MTSVRMIYVVVGETGEYSDRTEWLVAAFDTEEAAKARVIKATDRARELEQWTDLDDQPCRYSDAADKPTNQYDTKMRMAYTGTVYHYSAVPLIGGAYANS